MLLGASFCLIVASRENTRFTPAEIGLAEAVCSHINMAMENTHLQSKAIRDGLTGLYRRGHFDQCIAQGLSFVKRHGGRLALLILDIDDFKQVNDTYGHPVGDLVLKTVAECLSLTVRESDMAFRYGGEEFVALLHDADAETARAVGERVRARVEDAKVPAGDTHVSVTVSVGISVFPDTSAAASELVSSADHALYAAKHSGKNRVSMFS